MVVMAKLLGVKKMAFVLLSSRVTMLQAIPTLVNLAMKITFLFTNLWVMYEFQLRSLFKQHIELEQRDLLSLKSHSCLKQALGRNEKRICLYERQ